MKIFLIFAISASLYPPALSVAALKIIEPVDISYQRVLSSQSKLGPPRSRREELERLYDLDQAGRDAWHNVDLSSLPTDQQKLAKKTVWDEIESYDQKNLIVLKSIIPPRGWFTATKWGRHASDAAFLIVQHAESDPKFMQEILRRLEPLAARHEIDGSQYAMLYDRVARDEGKPQKFGTQMICSSGRWVAADTSDIDTLDERRASLGLGTEADYVNLFSDRPPC